MMTLTRELTGSELRILRTASNHNIYRPIYDDTRAVAHNLAAAGLLESLGDEEYRISPDGWGHLKPPPVSAPAPRLIDDTPKPRRSRKVSQKPQPQSVKITLRPVGFRKLRERQRNILRFIDQHIKQMGFPPTYREIGAEVGIPTSSVVAYNIDQLIVAGWMDRTVGVPRSLCLTQELPGGKTKNDIRVTSGVLKITVQLTGSPDDIVEAAQAAIARLQEVIASVTGGG
jgi:hypothetical protein